MKNSEIIASHQHEVLYPTSGISRYARIFARLPLENASLRESLSDGFAANANRISCARGAQENPVR